MIFGLGWFIVLIILATICFLYAASIKPECPQCEKPGEITDSSISKAWLDCRCLSCNYQWRIQ